MRFKIGILGCGVAAEHQIVALKRVPGAEIVWFCDPRGDRADTARELWGRGGATGQDFESLLSRDRPDVVHVCTPPRTHADLSVRALDSGAHVLLEKPMAVSVAEAERILEARNRAGLKVCMMHNHLFDPPVRAARRMIEGGRLGELVYGEGRYFLDTRKMAQEQVDRPGHWAHALRSGLAGEYMPHTIYLLQSFFGPCRELQVIKGSAAGSGAANGPVRTSYAVQMGFPGAVGRILLIDRMPYGHFGLDLYGAKAALHINMMDLTWSLERIRNAWPLAAARMGATVEQSVQRLGQTLFNGVRIATGRLRRRPGHRALIEAFYRSLEQGGPVPVPAEDGLSMVRTMEKIDAATGGPDEGV
jgi:predicted dehydrogenase